MNPSDHLHDAIEDSLASGSPKLVGMNWGLTEITPEITQLIHLEILSLISNLLKTIPPFIGELKNLRELALPMNQIREIPPEITQLPNLQILELSLNKISEVPAFIGELTQLHQLSLNKNLLHELPPEIGNLSELERLAVSMNQLEYLPLTLGQLDNLTELVLNNNQLHELPQDLSHLLPKLRVLDISNNNFTVLPNWLIDAAQTWHFSVKVVGNPLANVPPHVVVQGDNAILEFLANV